MILWQKRRNWRNSTLLLNKLTTRRFPTWCVRITFALAAALCISGGAHAVATPTKVQRMTCENWISNSAVFEWANATHYKCIFDNKTQAGNAILLCAMWPTAANAAGGGGGITLSISDDQTNTYNSIRAFAAGSLEGIQCFIAQNIAANTQVVTLTWTTNIASSGDAAHWLSVANGEWRNLPTSFTGLVDGSSSNTGTGAACTSGSFTPGTSGDLIFMACANDNHDSMTVAAHAAPLSLFTVANLDESFATQAGVQTAAAAINPQLDLTDCGTIGGSCASEPWVGYAFALKASSSTQGSGPPAGIYVEHTLVVPVNGQFTTKTEPIQFPADGNLIVIDYNAQAANDLCVSAASPSGCTAAQADSKSNSYSCDSLEVGTGGSGDEVMCWAGNATTDSTLKVTASFNIAGPTVATVYIHSVEGAATSPSCGAGVTNTASLGAGVSSWTGAMSITPCAANGVVFGVTGVQSQNGISVSPGLFAEPDQNNFDVLWYNGSTVAGQSFTYTTNTTGVGAYVELFHAFKAAPSSSCVPSMTELGTGRCG